MDIGLIVSIFICIILFILAYVIKNNKARLLITGLLIIAIIYTIYYNINIKKKKIKKISTTEIWEYEQVDMNKSFIQETIPSAIEGPPGVTYTMNINIRDWMHNNDVAYREIFTHGNGSFDNLENNDILSVAIDGHKNDIYIDVNTKQYITNNKDTCNSYVETANGYIVKNDNIPIENITERIVLKYFPIDKYFNLAIVLSNNRVDTYLDGKLNITKVLQGYVNFPNEPLPLQFFKGKPIKGYLSNFKYFNKELSLKLIQDIFTISQSPKMEYSQLSNENQNWKFIESQCN